MESSTVLAFRIFVMLSCLIIVPMAAIFGSAFPDVVKTVLVDRIVSWSTGKPLESNKSDSEIAGFSEVTPASGGHGVPNGRDWEAPRWGTQASGAAAWQPAPSSTQASGVTTAGAIEVQRGGANQAANFSTATDASRTGAMSYPLDRSTGETPNRNGSAENLPARPPFNQPGIMAAGLGEPTARPLAAQPEPDRFITMERKLREYGASYYILETWGNDGDLYRFHCRMAISNNPNYTRPFEATDRDALKAMSQVLERVEAWRGGRLP